MGGVNYLLPVGAKINKESDVKHKSVSAEKVLDEMAETNNGLNIVILDACRDNPFARSMRSASRGLAIISSAPEGTFISYATGAGQTAGDGDGRNSPYTVALLKNIKKPGLPIERVFKQVRVELSRQKQTPWELSSLKGEFYFRPGKEGAISDAEDVDAAAAPGGRDYAMAPRPRTEEPDEKTFTSPTLGAKFVLIPAGTFTMGSPLNEPGRKDDETAHQVTITKPFYMQTTEVTQGQWKAVMGVNPSRFSNCGDDCPVEQVSWNDVQEFIRKLNQREGTDKYRLPTEAQWEYAARSGTQTALYNGPLQILGNSNGPALDSIAWYSGNSGVNYSGGDDCPGWTAKQYNSSSCGTHPVGGKAPNAWGLYDMLGNVREWVSDWKGDYPSSHVTDTEGPSSGSNRILHGGGWDDDAASARG